MLLLSPYAPHLAEELWASRLGHTNSLAYEPWPEADESLLVVDTIKLPVQVGSRVVCHGWFVTAVDQQPVPGCCCVLCNQLTSFAR